MTIHATVSPCQNRNSSLDRWLENRRAEASDVLEKFAERFRNSPADAFEWSDAAFQAAAMQHACSVVLSWRAKGVDLKAVREAATSEFLRRAGSVRRSTSPSSNHLSLAMQEAWGRIREQVVTWTTPEDAGEPAEPHQVLAAVENLLAAVNSTSRNQRALAAAAELESSSNAVPGWSLRSIAAGLLRARIGEEPARTAPVDLSEAEAGIAREVLVAIESSQERWLKDVNVQLPLGVPGVAGLLCGRRLSVPLLQPLVDEIAEQLAGKEGRVARNLYNKISNALTIARQPLGSAGGAK